MKNNTTKGIFFALAASVISGIAIFYSKISVAKIDPLVLTTSRNFVAAMLLVTSYLLLGRKDNLKKIKRNDFIKLLLIGIFGGGISFYLFFTGLKLVDSAITANLIQKTLFIWVSLLSLIFLKEKLNWKYWLSFFLVILANFYFAKFSFKLGKGELMILVATLLWSAENIIAKKVLKNISSELTAVFRMGIGSLFLITTTVFSGKIVFPLTINQYPLIIILIGGTILFFYVFFWFKALKHAPASLVTLVLTFSVVIGNILNSSFAGIKLVSYDIISSVILLMATALTFFNFKLRNGS